MKKKFPWLVYLLLLGLIVAFALTPVGSVIIAGVVANANGCSLDEGSPHPCVIAGHDYGQTLYTMGVLGWLMLLTLPAGGVARFLWLVLLLFHHSRWKRRAVAAEANT